MRIITAGATRLVILAGPYAIKFARFRFGYCLERVWSIVYHKQTAEKMRHWRVRDGSAVRAVFNAFFAGILANRSEYRCWRKHRDPELVPTLCTFLWLVNVQVRGELITPEIDLGEHLLRLRKLGDFPDVELKQFCLINGLPKLADYGATRP